LRGGAAAAESHPEIRIDAAVLWTAICEIMNGSSRMPPLAKRPGESQEQPEILA
jgi:hypothetical protein